MQGTTHRTALMDYIATADERKVEAMYTLVEQEIDHMDNQQLSDEQWIELEKRVAADKAGEMTYSPWNEVMARLKHKHGLQ